MTPPPEDTAGPVGSVGDEAAKLLGALAGWASDHAGGVNDHVATGAAECLYCPICRTVHAVRGASPEMKAQLADAASTFLQAAAGLLSATGGSGSGPSRVQHIDLDDQDDLDDLDDLDDGSGDPGEDRP